MVFRVCAHRLSVTKEGNRRSSGLTYDLVVISMEYVQDIDFRKLLKDWDWAVYTRLQKYILQ